MEAYPHHYVAHNLPFVTLFGLDSNSSSAEDGSFGIQDHDHGHLLDNGITYEADLPLVTGDAADLLHDALRDLDARDASWNGRPGPGKMGSVGFTYRSAGSTLKFPPRKALPPPKSELDDLPANWQVLLHSPISPLTPSSPLFPDGILTPAWMAKHQALLPTAVIAFYSFTVDPSRTSLEDNALKSEINRLQSWIKDTKYGTRAVIVLVCEAAAPVSAVVERLGNIRRATNLDTKTLLYMPAGLSADETRAFVGSLLSNIHATCIEYYRDLSKHARRKKNRGNTPVPTIPPTFTTSQILSARSWNLRYEMKLGVFAEFRGEMEAALRNYESAYEDIMDGDVFDGMSNWSPRFNEARMLADVLAIRILRCLLWTNQTTTAAQSWSNHKFRIQTLLDDKGKGTSTYAWPAWQATWSTVMAEIIEKAQLPFFHVSSPTDDAPLVVANLLAPAERTISKETLLAPTDYLHQPGYWYEQAARKLRDRTQLAKNLPAEDRRSPGESPASHLANRSHLYDTYLCPEPHLEYLEVSKADGAQSRLLLTTLNQAATHAEIRQESRILARLRQEIVTELASQGAWEEASELIKKVVEDPEWRKGGWWHLLGGTYTLAHRCFYQVKAVESLLSVDWQLQSDMIDVADEERPKLEQILQELELKEEPQATVGFDKSIPCLRTSFIFGSAYACVGDPLPIQVTLEPCTHTSSGPVKISSLNIELTGSVFNICLNHEPSPKGSNPEEPQLQIVQLKQNDSGTEGEAKSFSYTGTADLEARPGHLKIYQFNVVPRENQQLRANLIKATVSGSSFSLDTIAPIREPVSRPFWWYLRDDILKTRRLDMVKCCEVEVKPRPPKLQIGLPDVKEAYYTDEDTPLTIRLVNEETDTADVRLKVHAFHGSTTANIQWADQEDGLALTSENSSTLPQRDVGAIESSATRDFAVTLSRISNMGKITFEIEAVYTLANSDPSTIVTQTLSRELSFVRPFEANLEASAGVHPAPWPSFFDPPEIPSDGTVVEASGLTQRSYVTAKVLAYTTEAVIIDDIELRQLEPTEHSVTCDIKTDRPPDDNEPVTLGPKELRSCTFTIDTRKHELDDRLPVDLQFCLAIKWRRAPPTTKDPSSPQSTIVTSKQAANTTILPGSSLRLDFGKPRALASATINSLPSSPSSISGLSTNTIAPSSVRSLPVIHLTYTIENPSDYMLQFAVAVDATEHFAFAGAKASSLQLVPFSRSEVRLTLLPFNRGAWISPTVRVTDVGFGEVLRVVPAEGVRVEKGRCLIWVPGEGEGEEEEKMDKGKRSDGK